MRLTEVKQREVERTGWFRHVLRVSTSQFETWPLLPRWFEEQQTAAGVKRVKDWAAAKSSPLEDSDIFISGNADEVFKCL